MHKNVDTGSGLERVATIIQKKNNVYETDLLWPILEEVSQFCGVKYSGNSDNANDRYLKIITDHARCVCFLVADGIRTSNVGRGYVLRFIIRRAARFGRLLGLTEPFIYKLAPAVISIYGNAYPELREQSEAIVRVIREEEERFAKTIDRGLSYLEPLLATNEKVISGEEAFNLYATYGFPLELTQEIAQEQNKSIDMEGFQKAREEHEQRSAASKFNVIITGDESFGRILREYGETRFLGYKELEADSEIIGLVKDGKEVTHLEEGQVAEILLDKTPFYGESGGQVGDTGVISTNDAKLKVLDTKKHEGLHVHKVQAISGVVELKESVHASVDKDKRHATVLHHSAAHLFHSAIRHLFGKQVVQAGQQVSPDVMRFDFTLDRQPTQKEIRQVEALMNEWVRKNLPVKTQEMSINEAKATGAIAMFGEKYGDVVRVVNMGDVSLEFCGGTHVSNTGEIGPIRLVSEGSIASGVRRVEGLAGEVAWNFVNDQLAILQSISEKFKTKPQELGGYLEKLQVDSKQKDKELEQLRERQALEKAKTLAGASAQKIDLNGKSLKVGMVELPEHSANVISSVATNLTESEYDIFIAGNTSTLVACASGMAVDSGFNANELFQDLKSSSLISKGGGKPKQAQGGRTPDKPFEEIKAKASNYLQAKLVAKK
jgi:alanyl-tRNA synthetase